jgi:6-phosphogluconolactonase
MFSNVTAFHYDGSRGALDSFQTISMLPDDFKGNSSGAEVLVHPNGKFVYGSNRGHDSIAVFSIDGAGKLKAVDRVSSGGKNPRSIALDPKGGYMFAAHQDSDNVVVFKVDQKTGVPKATGDVLEAGAPVCVIFVPAH